MHAEEQRLRDLHGDFVLAEDGVDGGEKHGIERTAAVEKRAERCETISAHETLGHRGKCVGIGAVADETLRSPEAENDDQRNQQSCSKNELGVIDATSGHERTLP
jgi:hypothetical protein